MATLQGKAVKNTYRQVLQIGASNVGVSGTLQPVQDGAGVNTALSLSTGAATVTGDLTITGDLIITGGGIQITDLIDDTVATLIQNGTGITWAYNDTLRTLTPTITIATADGGAQADYLQLNTGANEASAVGKLKWNSTDGTMDIGLMGGQVTLQVGQEQVARVLNNSGSILTEAGYQAVKISSAQGQRLAVTLAQANNEANSTDTLGLVTENIANNQEGFVTTSGLIRQIDTTGDLQLEDWNDGDTLYLSPTIPGGVTKVKPTAPQQTVIVGFVVYAHKTQGKIYVKVDNGYELEELHNVKITSVANDNILQYNSSLGVWENVAGTTTNIAEGSNLYYTQGRFDSAFAAKSTTNLAEGTNLYYTETRATNNFDTNLAASTTTDLAEGTNLYYTNTRARLALDVTAGTGISYNNGTGVFALGSIPNSSLTNSSVTINSQALALGGSVTLTTSDIAEGTNLYWTNARFDSRFGTKTTTDLAEGTNLYYTQARFNTAFDAKTTTDLDEGTNLYYTDARARAAFSENATGLDYSSGSGILSLTSGYAIPTTVKLGEYDTAYNRSIVSAAVTGTGTKTLTLTEQDANTITATWTDQGITTINGTANQIAASTVGNTTTVGFTNDVTFPNNVVVSGNLTINGTATYVNTQSISSKDPLFEVANDNNTTDAVDIGYYGRYFDSAQTRVEFTGLFRDASDAGKYKIFSGLVDEPTNVVDTTGTGYTVGTLVANVEGNLAGTANAANVLSTARSISATGDAAWTVSFDGSANATAALTLANTGVTATTYGTTTAVPTIAVDGKGRITSASNTNIAFPVTTVNSFSGNVVLTTSDVAEGTNQYFTTGRVSAYLTGAISPVLTADLTASRALVSDGNGKITASASATATEVSYLAGVTSAIQTQLNTKAADNAVVHLAGTETITGAKTFSGGLSSNALTLTGALTGTSATFSGAGKFGGDIYNSAILSASGTKSNIGTFNNGILAVIDNNALGTNIGGAIEFRGIYTSAGDFTTSGVISTYKNNATSGDYGYGMQLYVRPNGSSPSVALTLASTGAATFSANIRSNTYISAIRAASDSGGAGPYLEVSDNTNSYQWQMGTSNKLHLFNYNGGFVGPFITVNGSGNVGFGTISPTSNTKLSVVQAVGGVGIQITDNTYDTGFLEVINQAFKIRANNNISFDANGAERMRITSGGQVGLGVVPKTWWGSRRALEIFNGGAFTGVEDGRMEVWGNCYLDSTATAKYMQTGYASLVQMGNNPGYGFAFACAPSGTAGTTATLTEAMRITSVPSGSFTKMTNYGGYFSATGNYHEVASNSSGNFLSINFNASANPYGIYIPYTGASPNGATNEFLLCADSSATRFVVRSNGGVANFQANNVNLSDVRTKKEITPLESYWDKFKAIEIVKFKYKDQTHDDFNIGVIAQQVETVAPEFVDIDGWDNGRPKMEGEEEIVSTEEPLKSIYSADLYHATIKVLQEAMAKIEILEAKIAILEAK